MACYPSNGKQMVYAPRNCNEKTMSICANYWKGLGNEFARPFIMEYVEI